LGAAATAQTAGFGAPLPPSLVRPILGAFAVAFGFSLVGNAASASRAERLHGVPLALILCVSCGVLALAYAPR
jgi:hypothetical protein